MGSWTSMQQVLMLVLAMLSIGCLALQSALHGSEPDAKVTPPTTPTELLDAIRKIADESKVPGVGLAIVNRDEVLLSEGIGLANVQSKRPVTTSTMFRAGSISKSFTALALLKLQEAGLLTIENRLSELIPEVRIGNRWDSTAPMKLVHLLEHTSALDDIPLSQYAVSAPGITLSDGVRFSADRRQARWQPGTFFSYSNDNFTLAGYVVEKVSGKRFDEYLLTELLQPLDMAEASFLLTDHVKEHIATGYATDGTSSREYEHMIDRSSGALNCTPTQLGHLVQMLLNRGNYAGQQLLARESIERMETPGSCLTAHHGIVDGYGLANFTYAVRGHRLHGHAGAVDGFLASYAYSPEFGMGYAFMINSSNHLAMNRIEETIQSYLAREWPQASQPTSSATPETWAQFAGYYEPYTLRVESSRFLYRLLMLVHIHPTDLGLQISHPFGRSELYVPTEIAGGFRRKDDPGTTLLFLDHEGQTLMASAEDRRHENLRRMPAWKYWGQTLTIGFCACAMLSSVMLALVWVPLGLFRRSYDWKQALIRLLPATAALCLVGFLVSVFVCLERPVELLAKPTVWSVSIMALTYLFFGLSIAGLCAVAFLRQSESRRWIWWHALLVATANGLVSLYLLYWGVIGLRTWA